MKEVTDVNNSLWIQDLNLPVTELTVLEPQEEELLEKWLPLSV